MSADDMRVVRKDRWLIASFDTPHQTLSWAIVGGGRTRAFEVSWLEVSNQELSPVVDPGIFLRQKMTERAAEMGVGLLTSRNLDAYTDIEKSWDGLSVRCVATAGFSNALRVGDRPSFSGGAGTVNILCRVSEPLSEEAMLETMAVVVEARTAAILAAGITSVATGLPATGTGTDCVVIASPEGKSPLVYAGKHTALGHVVGAAVYEAVGKGAERWKEEWLVNGKKKGTLCSGIK